MYEESFGYMSVSQPFNAVYNSYAGVDLVAMIVLPNEAPVIIGELQTISYSIHRENVPLRGVGHVSPIGFVKGPRCLPASEKVLIKNKGYISIAAVEPGDYVQSSSNSYNCVMGSHSQGFKSCYKIKLQNGYEIITSYDHPISTTRGWVQAQDLSSNDRINTVGKMPVSDEEYPISDDLLKMIALLTGDGSCHIYSKENGSQWHVISLAIAETEMDTIGKESEEIINRLGLSFRDERNGSDQCVSRYISICLKGQGATDWRKRQYGKLHEILQELDLYGRYSHTKIVPPSFIEGLSKRQIILYLHYLFSTDGCYSVAKSLIEIEAGYSSTSESLIDDVRLLLMKIGIPALKYKEIKVGKVGGRPNIISRHDSYTLTISNALELLKFIKRIGIFGKDDRIEPYIDRLMRRMCDDHLNIDPRAFLKQYQEAIDRKGLSRKNFKRSYNIYNYNLKITPKRALRMADALGDSEIYTLVDTLIDNLLNADKDLIPLPIKSISAIGQLPVYDLEVESRHEFISGFVKVHNTIAGSMIFTNFDEYFFYKLESLKNAIGTGLYPLADMLPPFDVVISAANEYGSMSKMRISGITIVDEGGVMSVDDLITETTISYMARGIVPMISSATDASRFPDGTIEQLYIPRVQ